MVKLHSQVKKSHSLSGDEKWNGKTEVRKSHATFPFNDKSYVIRETTDLLEKKRLGRELPENLLEFRKLRDTNQGTRLENPNIFDRDVYIVRLVPYQYQIMFTRERFSNLF